MPIFEYNGKKFNVKDEYIDSFIEDYPDASTVMEREGKKYRVKSTDYNTFLQEYPQQEVEEKEDSLSQQTEAKPLTEQDKIKFNAGIEQMKQRIGKTVGEFDKRLNTMQEYNEGTKLNYGQTVEGKMQFNPQSGKIEKTYISPTGNRHTSKEVADIESLNFRQAADVSVGGQLRRANQKLEELKEAAEKRKDEVANEHLNEVRDRYRSGGILNAIGQAAIDVRTQTPNKTNLQSTIDNDAEYRKLIAAIHQKEEQIATLEREVKRENGVDVGFWRGFADVAGDAKTWDFGYNDIQDALAMHNASKGNAKTDSEKGVNDELLSAVKENQTTTQEYGDNDSFWYRAGTMTGHMPAFMLDFALTGGGLKGINLIAKGATKLATKAVGKEAVEQMAKEGFKSYVKSNGIKGLGQYAGNWAIKAMGTMADDLLVRAPLMTNTVQLGKTTADIIDRKLGNIELKDDGTYNFSNDKTWGSAIWQGEANNIIENYSEMFGAHLDPVVTLGNIGKLADVIGAKRLGKILAKADAGALGGIMGETQKLFNKMGVSDYFGEVAEEYYGQLWRTMLNLDDAYQQNPDGTRTNLLATGRFHGDILGGMALSMGLMGAGKLSLTGAQYVSMKHGVNKADNRASELLGKEVWEPLREVIDNTTNDNFGEVAEGIVYDKEFTDDERAAILTYMERAMMMRGFNLATFAESRGEQDSDVQEMNASYIDGYNIANPTEMNDAKNMLDYQRQRMISVVGTNEETLDGDFVDWLNEAKTAQNRNDYERANTILDYLNAKQVYDGMMQRVRDDIDSRIDESNNIIDKRTNKATGLIQGATLKRNNRSVYIVNGNVVQNGNGGIDLNKSEKSIIVCDAETGEFEQIPSDEISALDELIDPTTEKEINAEAIRQQFAGEAADKIDGVVAFNPGDTYSIAGDNGVMQVQVVANEQGIVDNGDGTVNVSDGVNVFPLAKEIIQQQVDEANKERLMQFEETRNEENNPGETDSTPTALELIPKDDQGNPIYEQTDSDTAWNALVEQTEGDVDMAQTVADGMVAKKEAALKKLEKAKSKGGETPAEMIAAEKERKAAIESAKQELDAWKMIAGTANRRRVEIEAEQTKTAQMEAERIKAEEDKLRTEREEAERIEREALNGVPDMVEDTPQDARARGYRRVNGHKVDRQEPVSGLRGKEVEVKFSDNTLPKGSVAVIEADELQPSHVQGMRNPLHFIDEAQPKERNDEASILSAQKIASNIRPEEITSSVTAYTGAPTVNTRGEAIQGNSRSDALRLMWESYPEQGAKYKQYLMDHAKEFGLKAEDIAGMKRPVLVNMLDVNDEEAITLGQFVAQDTESGGVERIKPKNALQRMGADMRTFANMLLKSTDEETSFAGLVDSNGIDVLKWMSRKGYISPTQYQSAFDSKGNLTAEVKNDLRGIMYQSIFKGGSTRLEEMFNAMPAKAQKAILATAFRDFDSPNAERMIEEIQNSIRAFYALSQSEAFMSAKTFKDARLAVEGWKNQYQFDDVTGESYLPAENFSNFALLLATMYKGENQSVIQGTFNKLYDIIQGTQEPNLFEQPDNTPRSLAQAIKEVLNLDYNGQFRSNVLVGDSSASQRGQQGSTGDAATGERIESGNGTTNSAGSIDGDSGEGEINRDNLSLLDVVKTLYSKGKEVASKLFSMKFFDVAQTPKFMQELGLRGDKFTIKYGVIARHIGKDSSHTLTEKDWEQLPQALQNPFAISKITDKKDSYRIYTTLQTESGEYIVVGADVKNAGREIEVNSISTVFGRRNNANLPKNEEVIYRSKEITPDQSSLLKRPNFAQYPTEEELSESKDTTNSQTTNELEEKNNTPYSITPAQYTTKKGKVLDMHLVKFAGTLTKEQQRAAKELAKAEKGWYDREQGGFMMRSEESAKQLAETILGNEEAVSDAQPVSMRDIAKINTTNNDLLSDEGATDDKVIVSNAIGKTFTRIDKSNDGTPYEASLTFKGIEDGYVTLDANLVDFGGPHKMSVAEAAEALRNGGWQEKVLTEAKNEGQFGLVSDERMAELKERLRKKLGGQLNVGIDPEILAIGLEIAVGHIDRGVKSFTDFAKVMIADLGDVVRPYLKAFYNGARDLPEVVENGLAREMTPYDEVQQFNVATFDKENSNPLTTAEIVVAEQAHNQEAEQAKQDIINQRNNERRKEDEQTTANTQAVASQAETVASEAESSIEKARTEEEIEKAEKKVEKQLSAIDEQLAKLNYIDSLHSGMQVVTNDGRSVFISTVMHKGEQLSATQFSKPIVHRLYGIHKGQLVDISPADVDVEATIRLNEGSNNVASQETPAKEAESYNGFKRGDKVMYTPQSGSREAVEATIHDFEDYGDHKPVLDAGLAPVLYEVAEWSDIKPIESKEKKAEEGKKSKKKTVTLQKLNDAGLFDGLFENENNNDNGLQRDDAVRTERVSADSSRYEKGLRGGSETGSESEQQGSRGTDLGRERTGDAQDRIVRPRLSDTVEEKKNTNNNHSERGKDHAPASVDARIEANIKAIELAKELLESGEKATEKQMQTLRKFSGWGGLGKAFNEGTYYDPNPIAKQLRELLGETAYGEAVMSANSAYYTPAYVIDTLWDIAERMGFEGGNILEGSAGIGNILGQMPTHISERSNIHAIEIDGTSGGILSLLYPDAKVEIQGFEETRIANGSVDLAITNVPFVTGLRVNDTSGDKDLSKKFHNIHDFCIAKNVRKLREGGLGIFITSNGTLDNSKKLRDWIVNEGGADFVGAFRLNNKTFGGTGVTSDIIVIRKRVNGKKSANAIDVSTVTGERVAEYNTGETRKVKGEIVPIVKSLSMDYNSYFVEHPENMAGEMLFAFEKGDTFRPTSKGLYPTKGKNQEEMLQVFANSFSAEEFGERNTETVTDVMPGKKIGEVFVKDGKLYINAIGAAQPLDVNANKVKGHTKVECFEAYNAIKKALNEVLEYQTKNEDDKGLKPLLDKLNKAYDDFVATYGHFNKNTAIAFLRNDVDYANVFALEKFEESADAKGNKVQKFGKTDVFSKRVIEKEAEPMPTNVKDGIVASIFKFGRVDVPYMAKQLGKDETDVKAEIIESGYGFEDPTSKQIEVSFQYLSGNVREKLRQAQENNENGEYDRNIKALQGVIPMNIPAHLIDFTLGSSWIDPKLYEDYVKDRTDVSVKFYAVGGTWFMDEPYSINYEKNRAMGVTSEMLGRTIMGHTLIEAAIQNKSITVSSTRKNWDGSTETITDKEATQACSAKIDEIRQDFKDWAREKMQSDAEMSERMERIYNETFNNYVPLTIPEEFVPEYFGGASHKFKMRTHQGKAIVRGTMQPLLLAHEVGTGKTFTLISTAMEMRRLGTARKPMIVVQNATVGQFVASAKELYPNAKILTLEEADRNAEGRKNFYAKIKYNDWDMIVVPQSTFEFIPDSEERQMTFVQDKIEEKMLILEQMKEADPNGKSMITRQAEREIELLEAELAGLSEETAKKRTANDEKKRAVALQNAEVKAMEMLDRRTDDVENFDDMGIDALLIDEAHEYKHLGFATAMQRGVKGVDPSYSKKSQGVFLKTQAILEKNNGRNVIFATGTPISNTAAEIWTFMRYLMPADTMKEYGIYYFDDFVRNFGNIQQMLEFTTSGKFKENNRFAGYVNLPELVRIWSGVSDTVLTKEAGGVSDKIPEMEGGKAEDLYLPQTRALRSIMKYVKAELQRYDNMSGKQKKENSHIPLTMYGIAKAATVDARLVQADAEDDTQSKTNEAVRQTLRALKDSEDYKGTVAIFADNYQNKQSGFNLYEDIRSKLIAEGVPADEIVVIKSGMTVKKKLEIFEKVNRGEIRVILGSTFTLGTGVNIQERLFTLIHLDAPNRPMDYTQRNGRILRQGNLHKDMNIPVRVLRFGVEDSLDVTAYQRLKTKGAIADSIMNGKQMMANSMTNRVLEEEEDVFGDTVAQLSGSEYAMLKNNAEKNVRKYASRKKQWEADQTYIHNAKPKVKGYIKDAEKRIEDNGRYLETVRSAFPEGKAKEIVIGKNRFASVKAMEDFFKEHNKAALDAMKQMREGNVASEQKRDLTIQIGNFNFVVTTKLTRQTVREGANLFNDVERKMTYSCEALGLENVPVHQNLLRNAIEDITENVITGKDFAERLEVAERLKKHNEAELEQLLQREGKPFEYENELKQAQTQYEEYAELMVKELAEKEAKYAEMDADVTAADNLSNTSEDDDTLYRSDEATKNRIEALFNQAISGEFKGKPISIGRLTDEGKAYLEQISGISFREKVDFVLNPSDLIHIYKRHFGENEKDGRNIPLDIEDIRSIVDIISNPDRVIYSVEEGQQERKMFSFLKEAEQGTYNLLEIYSDRKGNLTTKSFYKSKEGVSQRVISLTRTLHSTSETDGATLNDGAKIPQMFENPSVEENYSRDGDAIYFNDEEAYEKMAERVEELAKKLNLDNVEIVTDASALQGKKQRAKGFYSKSTGKINIVIPNHRDMLDVEQTLLHEAVAHYGLRELFGEEFDNFLDNIYAKADKEIREKIVSLAIKNGWDFRRATEEYLASLAENTEFENCPKNWWNSIKEWFKKLLDKFGFSREVTLNDNSLRYILWRSYENLKKPADKRNAMDVANDIALQYELKVGNFAENFIDEDVAKEYIKLFSGAKDLDIRILNSPDDVYDFAIEYGETEENAKRFANKYTANKVGGAYVGGTDKILIFAFKSLSTPLSDIFHEHIHYAIEQLGGVDNVRDLSDELRELDNELVKKIESEKEYKPKDVDEEIITYSLEAALSGNAIEDLNEVLSDEAKSQLEAILEIVGYNKNINYGRKNEKFSRYKSGGELEKVRTRTRRRIAEYPIRRGGSELHSGEDKGEVRRKGRDKQNSYEIQNQIENDDLFRDGDPEIHERVLARERYERRVKSGMYQSREALQDSMLGLKEAMQAIVGKGTNVEDIEGFENAYLGENRLSSVNKAEADAFAHTLFKPMLDEVAKLAKNNAGREELTDYMMAKHGLERNRVMAERDARAYINAEIGKLKKELKRKDITEEESEKIDRKINLLNAKLNGVEKNLSERDAMIWYETRKKTIDNLYNNAEIDEEEYNKRLYRLDKIFKEGYIGLNRDRDYAGLTALTGMDNVADAEAIAQEMVDNYEQSHDTTNLWNRINAVSKAILLKSYESGLMSKETFNDVSTMYEFYIPLRGFDEKTSAEAYAYLTHKDSAFNAPIKKAKGRKSKADDPLANLESMAESAIMQGNRNSLVKQRFLNFVLNHPSDLVSVSDLWLKYDEVTDEWKPVFPDNIDMDDAPEDVERKMQEFEARMDELAEEYPDEYKRGKDAVNIPYRVVEKGDLMQHQVIVKRGGRDYVITINGNPRVAQALNGQTNPDNDMSGAIGAILRAGEKLNRQLSAFYTTRNPDFIVSNFVRDMLYTNSMAWIKESPNYALRFHRNYVMVNPVTMKILFAKHRNGTLNLNDKTEAMFYQFMMNGGETGYANIRDIEKHKNDIKRELKKSNGKIPVQKAWDLLGERFDELNRAVENCARFAAFVTSREMGRTIDRAIYDAKEISVNFNKKGSGAKFLSSTGQTKSGNASAFVSGLGRTGFVFWNAAIQATTNFGKQIKRHPAKAFTGMATMFILGAVVAYLGGDDDEEDKNAYYNLPEYVRRTNIMFRAGDSWISIPLPIEFRAVYGMGELMTSVLSGKEHFTGGEIAEAVLGQATQVLPIDFMEGSGGLNAFVPSIAKPFTEAYISETSWTGLPLYKDTPYNKDMPEWTKAYKSANKYLVNLSATLNEATGGDKYTKGTIDINPAKLEYMLNGYFGGVSGTIDKLTKTAETITGEREYDPRSILLWNRLVKAGDERTEYRAVNNEYYRIVDEVENTKRRLKAYEKDTDNGIFDFAEKIDFLYNSPEYERYEIFEEYNRDIKDLNDELKEAEQYGDKEEIKAIETELNALKKEMIQEMEHTYQK